MAFLGKCLSDTATFFKKLANILDNELSLIKEVLYMSLRQLKGDVVKSGLGAFLHTSGLPFGH